MLIDWSQVRVQPGIQGFKSSLSDSNVKLHYLIKKVLFSQFVSSSSFNTLLLILKALS